MTTVPDVWDLAAGFWAPPRDEDFELAQRCATHLPTFIREAWPILEPATPYVHGWHIEVVCEHLEAVTAGELPRLLINIPPRCMKSLTAAVCWPAWEWLTNPAIRWLCASYAADLSTRDSLKCRRLIESKGGRETGTIFQRIGYQGVLALVAQHTWRLGPTYGVGPDGRWSLTGDQNAKTKYETTATGMRLATSVGGVATGEGGDRILVDDPTSAKQARSEAERKAANTWWDETMTTRFNNAQAAAVIVMQRLHECLLPESRILTPTGSSRADEVEAGDIVLTSRGPQPVVAVAETTGRDGLAIGVRTYGHPETLWVTPEHPLLTDDGWKAAGGLTTADHLVFPVPTGETTSADLRTAWPQAPIGTPRRQHHTVTGRHQRVREEDLRPLVAAGMSSRAIGERLGKSRVTIDSYITVYGLTKMPYRPVDAAIVDDPGFWWIVGLWLAEGCLGRGRDGGYERVRFTLARTEQAFIDRMTETMGRYGIPVIVHDGPSVFQVSFAARQVAQFLARFGLGAHGKHLPSWAVLLPAEHLRELLRGWWDGDGCVSGRGEVRVGSVSLPLMEGFQRALLRLGIVASIMRSGEGGPGRIGNQTFVTGVSYELRFPSCDAPWLGARATDGSLLVPRYRQNALDSAGGLKVGIKAIETREYVGQVYDVQTPAGDFLCNLLTAHNCDLTGHLIESGDWHHLCLPGRYEPSHPFVCPESFTLPERTYNVQAEDGSVEEVIVPGGRVLAGDPRTEEGELLEPVRLSEARLDELLKGLLPYGFAGQIQQRPSPEEGGMFKRHWWKRYDASLSRDDPMGRPDDWMFERMIASWDMRFSDSQSKASSYVVGQVWGQYLARFYLLGQVRARLGFTATCKAVLAVQEHWPTISAVLIEKKANGEAVMSHLARKVTGMIPVEPEGGKAVRASAVEPNVAAGDLWLPATEFIPCPLSIPASEGESGVELVPTSVASFVEEHAIFDNGAHDDQVDAMSQAITWLLKHSWSDGAIVKPKPGKRSGEGVRRSTEDLRGMKF